MAHSLKKLRRMERMVDALGEQLEQMAQGPGRPGSLKDKRLPAAEDKAPLPRVRPGDPGAAAAAEAAKLRAEAAATRSGEGPSHAQRVSTRSPKASPRKHGKKSETLEMGIKNMEIVDDDTVIQTVEILKRPGQTLGFYIREGNGMDRHEGVFISRIASGSVVENNGLLRIGDEILTVNQVDVSRTSLDDVVILMSIPKRLVLTIRTQRTYSKNASCPSLCTIEQEEVLPVVVVKKGRSSSATAVEVTEKCPDEFILASTEARAYYAKHAPGYIQKLEEMRRAKLRGPPGPCPPFKFGGPGERQSTGDDSGDSGLSSENSQYSRTGEGSSQGSQQPGPTPTTPGQLPVGVLERAVDDVDAIIQHSDPGSLLQDSKEGRRSPKLSPRETGMAFRSPRTLRRGMPAGHVSPYVMLDYSSDPDTRLLHERATSDNYVNRYSPRQYDLNSIRAFQDEIERTHGRYEGFVNTKHKFSKSRSLSPECYNSDSEVVYRAGGGVGLVDVDERCNSLPRMDSGENSEEIKHWLRKFDTLAYDLQGSDDHTPTGPPVVPPPPGNFSSAGGNPAERGYLSDSAREEEYWTWLSNRVPPVVNRSEPRTMRPGPGHPRVTRKLSADSLLDYRTYQLEASSSAGNEHASTQEQAKYSNIMQNLSRGHKISHSYTSLSSLSTPPLPTKTRSNTDSDTKTLPPPSARIKDLQLARKPLQIRIEEFCLYKPEVENKKVPYDKVLDGLLSVHIFCGHGLKSSRTMLRDLYCVIEVDSINKARTMIRTGAINFDWDEAFDVELENAREVSYLVYSWDPNTRHRLCFSGTVLLQAFLHGGNSQKVALKLEPKGILYLQVHYKEPALTLQRTPSIRKNALFGVELESVVKREKSGFNVPILVQRCIEEVERRGLDHVGIYRLCGSAKRKTQLKEEFERNSRSVDLSPDNVSDINVITGVLKDFLRELPEPLFTNALYQMLLDALSVRLPGDPDGSAKLMLSILECLPKANQDTLVFLLDHLKRLSLKSDVNKMTSHNLAICFGPVLLCPSPACTADAGAAMDFKRHIDVLHYLLEIWPENRDGWRMLADPRAAQLLARMICKNQLQAAQAAGRLKRADWLSGAIEAELLEGAREESGMTLASEGTTGSESGPKQNGSNNGTSPPETGIGENHLAAESAAATWQDEEVSPC